jgi:hypothetical protein
MTKERDMHFVILLMIAASQEMQTKPVATAFAATLPTMTPLQIRKLPAPRPVSLLVQPRQADSGNCAIPLLNALKGENTPISNMPVLKPQGEFKMPIVTPVPVCGTPVK